MSTNPSVTDGNNPAPRSSQNKPQLLEATMRNVPKLKELNYAQWKNIITNSIKRAKLWDYVDGSIEEPPDHDPSSLATYYDEAAAVRNAILGSLEPAAQKYIEEALDPRDAWLALEKKYLTAEAETDSKLVSIEKQLADLRLEEGGDMIEHIAEFCRMRSQLSGTRLAMDDQACISMLYRSLPPAYRQSVLTPEGTEMKEFSALCARLTYLSQNPKPEAPIDEPSGAPVEDYTNWGVPEDIIAFGLTGDKNPLLEERAAATCRDCLLKGHSAGTPECPQYEWRKELWGTEVPPVTNDPETGSIPERSMPVNSKRLIYEFSDPVKVVLDINELGLKMYPKNHSNDRKLSAIQQCAILPMIEGRNVLAQAPPNNGKTTALIISILQIIDTALPHTQALVLTPTAKAATTFWNTFYALSNSSVRCFLEGTRHAAIPGMINQHIFIATPGYLLGLVHRNVINMRKLRLVVLDDVDKLMEAGMEVQILEVYRHIPPLAQVIASTTVYSSSVSSVVSKLLADPLHISVKRNEGITTGTHFYLKVPAKQKPDVLRASFSALGVQGLALLCNDVTAITHMNWGRKYQFYYVQESTEETEWSGVIQSFISTLTSISSPGYSHSIYNQVSNIILAISDGALSTITLSKIAAPLINYDVPSNAEDYMKRLDHWRSNDPGQSQMVLTFVTDNTEEMHVIRDLEQYYGVHVAEMLWDPESKEIS